MKKVLFIGHESDLNGASISLLNIISVLENDYKIYVLTSYKEGAFYDELKKHKVKILVYPFYRWLVKKHYSRFAIKNEIIWIEKKLKWKFKESGVNEATAATIAKIIMIEGIDVIHSNTGVINIGAMIKSKVSSNVKHIWHLREFGNDDFDMYPLVSQIKYHSFMNANADTFICISKAIEKHYSWISADKKAIVYNGIDKENYIKSHTEHSGVNFLISGRLSETKGQREAVEACLKLVNDGFTDFVLNIAGAGRIYFEVPKECEKNIVFLGQVSDMPGLRENMDVELVCSKAEAFGRVTAEAMMSGLPVIGSNTGGTPELIKNGRTGFLYQYGNTADLAEKMKFFLQDKSKIKVMADEAQQYALEHFTIERCVAEIIGYY